MDIAMISTVNDNGSKKISKKNLEIQDIFSDILLNQVVINENTQKAEINEEVERIIISDEFKDIENEPIEPSEKEVSKDVVVNDNLIEKSTWDTNLNNYFGTNLELKPNIDKEIKELVTSEFKNSTLSDKSVEINRELLTTINLSGKTIGGLAGDVTNQNTLGELKDSTEFENIINSKISLKDQKQTLNKDISIKNVLQTNNEINSVDFTKSSNISQTEKEINFDESKDQMNNQINNTNENDVEYQNYNMLTKNNSSEITKETGIFSQSKINENTNFKTENLETIVTKIIDETEILDNKNSKSFKITLKPENLGDLDVIIDIKDGKLIAKFIVDTPKVRDLITHSLPMLQESLEKQNIVVSKTEVSLNLSAQTESQFDGNLDQRQQNQQKTFNSNKQTQQYDSKDEFKKVDSNNNGDSVDILV